MYTSSFRSACLYGTP